MEQQWTSEIRYNHLLYRQKATQGESMKNHRASSTVLCGQGMTVVKFMLQNGETVLHKAALRGYVEAVTTLVNHGVVADIRNEV